MASYSVATLSMSYLSITDKDCPYMLDNYVCLQVVIERSQVVRLSANVTCAMIKLTRAVAGTQFLTILPPPGSTIMGASSFTMLYDREVITLTRVIGSATNYVLLENSSEASIPTIGLSTNNAIVRVGATPGTVANSTTLIDNTGALLTAANITTDVVINNGLYFYANTGGVSVGSIFPVINAALQAGLEASTVTNRQGIYIGYRALPTTITTAILGMAIGSQTMPNAVTANTFNTTIGYNAWMPAFTNTNGISIGSNLFQVATVDPAIRPLVIGRNIFNDITSIENVVAIGNTFTTAVANSVLIGSNIAPNITGTTGFVIVGHNSVTDAAQQKSGLTVLGTACNTNVSNSIIMGYGINARGVTTADVICLGANAMATATALVGTTITVVGQGAGLAVSGSNVIIVGSGAATTATTTLFACGYQAAATATATTCAVLGFQAGQTGNITNSAAIGNRALNAGGQSCVFVGSLAGQTTTGAGNTGIGYNCAATLTTGTNNIFIGSGTNVNANNLNNTICLGRNAVAQATGEFALGAAGTALTTQLTVGAAGGAAALPASPTTYLFVRLNGTLLRTPCFA
jgi:hypothetical protein